MKLHAIWQPVSLWLWAQGDEPQGRSAAPPERLAGGDDHLLGGNHVPAADHAGGADHVVDHPFALSIDAMRAAVGEITGDGLLGSAAAAGQLTLWLPHDTLGVMPCDLAEPVGQTHLGAVRVPALQLSAGQAIDLLRSVRTSPNGPRSVGSSVGYFASLLEHVIARIGLKQFYPDLDQVQAGQYLGVWRLITTETEAAHLGEFAGAMPGSCRCVVGSEIEAGRVVDSFVATMADAFIRRAASLDPFFTRVHDLAQAAAAGGDVRWLSSLIDPDARLRGRPEDNAHLADHVRGWVSRLDESRATAPWQLVFSLREPALPEKYDEEADFSDGGDVVWRLVLQLQAPGEDGTLADAEDLWDEQGDPTAVFGRSLADRKAQLTADITRATEFCPVLSRLAEEPTPHELEISTAEAHLFIRQWAPVLSEQGFGVTLPDWATRRERGLGMLLSVRPSDESGLLNMGNADLGRSSPWADAGAGRFGLESLLDFDWQIAVGDLRLSPDEFQKLAAKSSPMVRYKGRWMTIDPQAGQRAVEFLSRKTGGTMTLAEALRTAYGAANLDTGLPVVGLSGSDWIDRLLSQSPNATALGISEQPKSFHGTLRPYQLRGLEWMAFLDRFGLGGCLADDMGLGKTIQLISLLAMEREHAAQRDAKIGPTLLFAPTSVVGNWVKELERFAPHLRRLVHHGPERLGGDSFVAAANASDIVITSYALAHRDLEDLRRPGWHRVAVDEAQKIKNPSAAASVAIRSIPAPRRIALTGTPVENHLSELWSIMELLNPGLLGNASEFRERFAVPVEKMGDKERAMMLRRMIQPFVLRRSKSDPQVAGDLPDKIENKVFCNLTSEQAAIYERITGEMLGQIDSATGIRRRGLILAALTRLKQVCDHPALLGDDPSAAALDGRSGKCERLVEMLEEVVGEGDAALIFTQYREMGHLLERLITERVKAPVQFLHGGTPARQRDAMIDRFQKPGSDIRLFILSLRAGGLGLNLTAANHVFHFDRWWNPAVEAQATDRAHRIGQTRTVQVHQYVCVGTLEERIDKLLADKLALADQVVGSGDEWLTDLSTDELRQYLMLSREAVGEF